MTQEIKELEAILPWEKSWLVRLNALLAFPKVDPWKLSNGDWEELLDRLHFILYNTKRDPTDRNSVFNDRATPEGVRDAHAGLKKHLDDDDQVYHLAEQDAQLHHSEDGLFYWIFTPKDFTTMVYMEFIHLIEASGVKHGDIRRCSYCNTWFVPRRKPPKGAPAYCSRKCANIVAARNYRASKKKAKVKKKKAKTKPK